MHNAMVEKNFLEKKMWVLNEKVAQLQKNNEETEKRCWFFVWKKLLVVLVVVCFVILYWSSQYNIL